MFDFEHHWFSGAVHKKSPNHSGTIKPEILVMHYTADTSYTGAITWLCDPSSKASAHFVVSRDGRVTQLVPCNKKAWHAGKSRYRDRTNVNAFSIGIELVNAGPLKKRDDGSFVVAWQKLPKLVHPNEVQLVDDTYWHTYSKVQLEVTFRLAELVCGEYGLVDIVGHNDVAPGRKVDPGQLFDTVGWRRELFGTGATA